MVTEDKKVSAIISEQFKRFREQQVPRFPCSGSELDKAASEAGIQSIADAQLYVYLDQFMARIIYTAKWN